MCSSFTTSKDSRRGGFSLLELLVTITVISLLAFLVVSISGTFKRRAEKAACISHMRVIHSAFMGYISDHGHWPQLPEDGGEKMNESRFFQFWIESLEPYGAAQDTWLCPSDKVYLSLTEEQKKSGSDKQYFGTYVPTPFDDSPSTPLRWNQPWVIERGDFHRKGSHILMPDGSVQESQNPFSGR